MRFDLVQSGLRHLLRLAGDFLDGAALEKTGNIDLPRAPFDLGELAESVVADYLLTANLKQQKLVLVRQSLFPLTVDGDLGRLRQVLANLVENACKFSPRGSTVAITAERGVNTASVSVRDEGPGFTLEEAGRLFTPFTRSGNRPSGTETSPGLGLSIAQEIAQLHGGRVLASNLSRLFQQLLDASLLEREIPFGESLRTTKRALYWIQDPTLRFWFRVYSSHRSPWHTYSKAEQARLIHDHAATVFEDACRQLHPEAARYWEPRVEFDLVRPGSGANLVVSEVKWRKLMGREQAEALKKLEEQWKVCELRNWYPSARFEVMGAGRICPSPRCSNS